MQHRADAPPKAPSPSPLHGLQPALPPSVDYSLPSPPPLAPSDHNTASPLTPSTGFQPLQPPPLPLPYTPPHQRLFCHPDIRKGLGARDPPEAATAAVARPQVLLQRRLLLLPTRERPPRAHAALAARSRAALP